VSTESTTSASLTIDQAIDALDKLRSSEEHFDEMKGQCRALASTWLLATFGALGFTLSNTLSNTIPHEVIALALGIAGAIGIFLLWILDLLVYHRLLDASFTEALKLEARFPQLPQVRRCMVDSQPNGQTPFYEEWFYIGGITAPVLISGVLFVRWCLYTNPASAYIYGTILLLGLGLAVRTVRKMSPNPALEKSLKPCIIDAPQ
jgi:hypothetical protein